MLDLIFIPWPVLEIFLGSSGSLGVGITLIAKKEGTIQGIGVIHAHEARNN
jgi:hypothetical protein